MLFGSELKPSAFHVLGATIPALDQQYAVCRRFGGAGTATSSSSDSSSADGETHKYKEWLDQGQGGTFQELSEDEIRDFKEFLRNCDEGSQKLATTQEAPGLWNFDDESKL